MGSPQSRSLARSRSKYSEVKYLIRLRREGKINDVLFRDLARLAAAKLIRAEINSTVENVFRKKPNIHLKELLRTYIDERS